MTQVILVVGPPLAGVDGVVRALRARLPDHRVVDAYGLAAHTAPDAVVTVVSAVAPMTRSDWDLIANAAVRTELVIGAVSKIDAHRTWRAVLETDRTLAADWAPHRRPMPWVGVAAAPHLGEPNVTELVGVLRAGLAEINRRNTLQRNGDHVWSNNRRAVAPAVESRVALQQARLRLLRFVRDGCASLRAELRDVASELPAGGVAAFEARVRGDAGRFIAELDEEITRAVGEAGVAPGLLDIAGAPTASRRLETRLMLVLGVGFGLGIALASSRLLAGLAPGLATAGWVAGGLLGLATVTWVVRTRGLLHDRALLDRWVTEVAASLRWQGEVLVAERMLAAESSARRAVQSTPKLVTGE